MKKPSNLIALFLLIAAIICIVFRDKFPSSFNTPQDSNIVTSEEDFTQTQEDKSYEPYTPEEKIVQIEVNRPTDLNNKTKEEVYELRKKYVETSIFQNTNYEPSEYVFGGIESGKPWVSTNVCHAPDSPIETKGTSEETRFINNPTILVGIEHPFTFSDYDDPSFCDTDRTNIMPKSVTYDSENKIITVTYGKLPFRTRDYSFYAFNGLNARDFGYKYVYLDKSKSTYDIQFSEPSNISKEVYELTNYLHVGGSCKVEGGCNNGSPRQPYIEFKHPKRGLELEKTITLKLWKEKPLSPLLDADITEVILFEK